MKIGIIGLGFVGEAIRDSFLSKHIQVIAYDKFKQYDSFEACLDTDIIFLTLPTKYNEKNKKYDISAIEEISDKLIHHNYKGLVIIKSTLEPLSTCNLAIKYKLKYIHNPEFLSCKTALYDFNHQNHIVLGTTRNIEYEHIELLTSFYTLHFPDASISVCSSTESESMKLFLNSFYSVKIQFFNELFLLCNSIDCEYNKVKELMLKNNWINPMHTNVPGNDGLLSYGGLCFPKDTNALLEYMKKRNTKCKVLESTIYERNEMREDNINII